MIKLGWKPDLAKQPGEKPDWDAGEKLGTDPVPEADTCRELILSILDQQFNDCVANAIFQAIRASHVLQGVVNALLGSRHWGYYLSRAQHHDTDVDEGTYIRMFFDALNKLGFPEESLWPYLTDYINGKPRWSVMPDTNVFRMAFDQKSPVEYRRITSQGDARILDVQRAVHKKFCVVFGTDVTSRFLRGGFDLIDPPGKNEGIVGGHAMVIAEYDQRGIWGPNSWGEDWNDDGWFGMTWDYVVYKGTRDLTIVEHVPVYSKAA